MDGPEQNRVRGDEGRGAVELQHRHALHVVLTGLPQTDVVIKWQHLERRRSVSHINGFVNDISSTKLSSLKVIVQVFVFICYLLRGYQPEQGPVEVDLLLQLLGGKERPFPRDASGLHRRKGYIEDRALHISVVLDVEHEHRLPFGGEHRRHALQEEAEQRRKEALLGHVLQTHRDAVGQHVIGDDGDTQRAEGHDTMDAIWKEESRYLTVKHLETRV